MILIEERDGEIVLRPASAATVRDGPDQVIQAWIAEEETGMREFESLPPPT